MYWRICIRNLVQARRRTFLLCSALGGVAMFMVVLMTLSQGISDTMTSAAKILVTGDINVGGFYKTRSNNAALVVTPANDISHLILDNVPEVARVTDRPRGWGKLTSAQGSLEALLSGVDLTQETNLAGFLQLAPEREYVPGGGDRTFGDFQGLAQPHSAILFAAQAKRLGIRVGDMLTISVETLGGVQNTDEVEVVAVARDAGWLSNRHVFVNKPVVRGLFALNDDATGVVMVYLHETQQAAAVLQKIRVVLLAHGFSVQPHDDMSVLQKLNLVKSEDWTGQRLDLTTWQDELGSTMTILRTINALTLLFVSILGLMVVAGIINTMWIAVRERTQEIGMLRAIGMSKPRVLCMFMFEAFILGLTATTLGSALGAVIALFLNAASVHVPVDAVQTVLMSDVLNLSVRPWHILKTIGCFTFFTALAALWPALLATRLEPLTAIQKVG